MAFLLCLRLGGGQLIHPDELLHRMTWQQFIEWAAYAEIQPWGPARDDLRVAALLSTIAAAFSDSVSPPSMLWPYWETTDTSPDVDALAEALAAHRARYGYPPLTGDA